MMTAKAQGKNQVVLYSDAESQRPDTPSVDRDVRSIAHLKMLQSLTGKRNRLNDVREIGEAIAAELRSLVDYHNCRVFIVDGEELIPVAFLGGFTSNVESLELDLLRIRVGEGITGHCAELGESVVVADAANCEFGRRIEGTDSIEESLLAVPLRYGSRVVGVVVVSKLGLNQFDEDDVRLLEVLAGHAAVAVENASLYESARREAESATTLLEFGRAFATASSLDEIYERIDGLTADLIGAPRTSIWIADDEGLLTVCKVFGYTEEQTRRVEERRFRTADLRPDGEDGLDPFVVDPDAFARVSPSPIDPTASYAVAPLVVGRRGGCIVATIPEGDFGERELRLL